MLKKSNNNYKENIFFELKNRNAILTSGDKSTGFNSLTVSWGGFGVLWGKDVCYLFVRKSRYTYSFLERSNSVTLSFLNDEYKDSVLYIGTHSGKTENKIVNANLHYTYDPDFDGAYIKESRYCFKMKKIYQIDLNNVSQDIIDMYYPNGDMHTMFICEIKQYLINEGD